MKKLIAYNIGIFIAILTISSGAVNAENNTNSFSPVDNNEIPRILNMISDKIQDNYKHIKTWKGEVKSKLDYLYEGKNAEKIFRSSTNNIGETPRSIINSIETIVEFSLDAEKDNVFVHIYSDKPIKYNDLDTGRDLVAKGVSGEERAVLTKEYYIKSRADKMRDGVITSHKAIKENLQDCHSCQKPPVFDPRESFEAGQPIWKTLRHILGQINKNSKWEVDGHNLKIEESKIGNIVQYRIIIPGKITGGNLIFTTMVFSGEKGFNIILFQVTDVHDRLFQKATWDYELVDDIYLPKETTQQNYMGKDGGLSYNKESSFSNSQINRSIPAETFTYRNLGLQNGDKFIDKIEGKEYKVKDANLVFVADLPAQTEPNKPAK
jgi:hypothetical protein